MVQRKNAVKKANIHPSLPRRVCRRAACPQEREIHRARGHFFWTTRTPIAAWNRNLRFLRWTLRADP